MQFLGKDLDVWTHLDMLADTKHTLASACCSELSDEADVSRATRAAIRPSPGEGLVCV